MPKKPEFELVDTGGGCTAWRCELPGGHHMLLTDNDLTHEYTEDDYAIGLYHNDPETGVITTWAFLEKKPGL